MNYIRIAFLGAFTVMSLGLASPSYACPVGCDPEPEPPTERVKGNNGLGNGDQAAPGNSLDKNKAENEVGGDGHPSGKPQNSD